MKRFIKNCEEFRICGSIADTGVQFTHGYPDNTTLYHIIIKGSVKMGILFESGYVNLDNKNNFVDTTDYLYSQRVYECTDNCHIFGFNPLNPKDKWDGRLIKESFTGDDDSWLICFDGRPVINGKLVNRFEYAKLEEKYYDVCLNDAIIGVFTRIYDN
tara:strand:+ start:283 stop:756 length:474 start_codon:yes stop_codon:yes gene_type:complete